MVLVKKPSWLCSGQHRRLKTGKLWSGDLFAYEAEVRAIERSLRRSVFVGLTPLSELWRSPCLMSVGSLEMLPGDGAYHAPGVSYSALEVPRFRFLSEAPGVSC